MLDPTFITENEYDGIDRNDVKYKKYQPDKFQEKYVGLKFNHLTAISPVFIIGKNDTNKTGYKSWWLFKCDCGKEICRRFRGVKNEGTKDCGCSHDEKINKNYIGKTFNYLTVIEEVQPDRHLSQNYKYYKCRCKCGNYTVVRGNTLAAGEVKSCGCLKKEQEKKNLVHGYNLIDLTGKKFGKLTVQSKYNRKDKNYEAFWFCTCDCGGHRIVGGSLLRNGRITSCGCETKTKGELKISEILDKNHIEYLFDTYYFEDLLMPSGVAGRYDFILLDKEQNPYYLIEFDGEQHFKPIEYFGGEKGYKKLSTHDKIKNQYALSHNLPLVRIPYYELENITYDLLFSDKYLIKKVWHG